MNRNPVFLLLPLVAAFLLFLGCSSGGHMLSDTVGSSSGSSPVRLAAADIQIGGRSVNNATISPGSGSSSLFTVSLADLSDRSKIGRMQMDYSTHSSMEMTEARMSVDCYDDGTHGDAAAGDGTYSYMDVDDHIGPHYESCASGSYTYTFHGMDDADQHTNTVDCRVMVE